MLLLMDGDSHAKDEEGYSNLESLRYLTSQGVIII